MAARNNRRRRRRGRFGFLYKLLSFVLILGALVAGCIVFFRVEEITVTGSTTYTQEEIIAAAGVEQGDNLFLISEVHSGGKIISQLPYISSVKFRRALPDGLVITVTECEPVAVVEESDGVWWVIDSGGKLLEQGGSELAERYPAITGLTPLMPSVGGKLAVSVEENSKLSTLKQLLAALEERAMLSQVQSIDLSGISEIHMGYEGRFTVCMPMYSDDFHQLMYTLAQAAAWLDDGQRGTIDLTLTKPRFIPEQTA